MRQTNRYKVDKANSLWQIYKTVSFWKLMKNFIIIQLGRYMPFLSVKNWLYIVFLLMYIGKQTELSFMVMIDIMYHEKISIRKNSNIGYNTTLLDHEYLIKEYRIGEINIGDQVMIGANTTILPGVTIGDDAVISAGTLV